LYSFGGIFGWDKIVFSTYYNYKNLSRRFRCHWGAGRDGLRLALLDDVLIIEHVINYGASSLLGASGGRFGWGKLYLGSITLAITYSIIELTIGKWDGMDGSGAQWMTCSIYL
jgi:hypothetical protein